MTYARLALRHPLDDHYPVDGSHESHCSPYWETSDGSRHSLRLISPRTTLLRSGFQRPPNFVSFNSFRPGPLYSEALQEEQLST